MEVSSVAAATSNRPRPSLHEDENGNGDEWIPMSNRWIGILLLGTTGAIVLAPPLISERPNAPYPTDETRKKVLYQPFSYEPQEFDPAVSYSAGESVFLGNVYEPPFQYHYLKRPYVLEPLTCREVPEGKYFDAEGKPLPPDADPEKVVRVTYEIRLKEGIRYHPHPCFAKKSDGTYAYHAVTDADVESFRAPDDFQLKGTRELIAADCSVEEIRRHVGADTLGYLSLEGMLAAATKPRDHYCTACWTGKYRVPPVDRAGKDKHERKC